MGGFVNHNESVEQAAARVLNLLTGLDNIYMEQIGCFGDVDRDPGGRVVSIAYFALINIADYSETLMKEHNAKWFSIDKIPALVFDHKKMLLLAKERLQQKLPITLLVLNCCLKNLPCGNYRIYTKLFTAASLIKKLYA